MARNRYLKFVDWVVNGHPEKKSRDAAKLKASQLNSTESEEHTEVSEISSTSKIRSQEVDDGDLDDSTADADGENSATNPNPASGSDSEVEIILTPKKRKCGVFLNDSGEEKIRSAKRIKTNRISTKTKPGPASKTQKPLYDDNHHVRKSPPSPSPAYRVKNYPRATRVVPSSYAENSDTDSDFCLRSSDSSDLESDTDTSNLDSDGSSVISSSQASEEVDSDIKIVSGDEDDEDLEESISTDPTFQPVVILETHAGAEAKLQEKKLSAQDWKNLDRERQDYEEEFLGKIIFSQCSLDYAIGKISEALNWNVFPFGATVLNRGNITRRQRKNPNDGEWLQIKQEFIRRHFKTALSITPCRGKWYCCKNRVDMLDFKEYLERFWKIEI